MPAPIGDHVEDSPEARALPHCPCDLSVDGVEERRHAIQQGAQFRVIAHVDERHGGEDDARVSCQYDGYQLGPGSFSLTSSDTLRTYQVLLLRVHDEAYAIPDVSLSGWASSCPSVHAPAPVHADARRRRGRHSLPSLGGFAVPTGSVPSLCLCCCSCLCAVVCIL